MTFEGRFRDREGTVLLPSDTPPNCADFFQPDDPSAIDTKRTTAGSYGLTLVLATKGAAEAHIEGLAQFTVNACLSGACELVIDVGDGPRVCRGVPPQSINVLPPHITADVSASSPTTTLTAAFSLERFEPLLDQYRLGSAELGHLYGRATPSPQAFELLTGMWRLATEEGPVATLLIDAATLQLLAFLSGDRCLAPTGLARPEDRRIARVIDYVEASLGEALSVTSLAEIASLSASHFSRAFKATTGETVWVYVQRRRAERAMELLRATRLPIVEIANRCGFAHQGHFTSAFKRHFGVTPGAFRLQLD